VTPGGIVSSIEKITLRHLKQPLVRPYRLSYRTFEEFEPYVIEIEDDRGHHGFADGHISPGSSSETRAGGWNFLRQMMQMSLGLNTAVAKSSILAHFEESKVAATALVSAIEVLEDHPILKVHRKTQLRLLTPINALDLNGIGKEVEDWLAMGFRTFKIKVGKDVEADLERVAVIQCAVAGRATLRLDANRAYSREQGEQFARSLDPAGIELFEQPCNSDAVANVSTVPLMLDEPICTLYDIDRAAGIKGVGFCKLKLKRFGSLERLDEGLKRVKSNGMDVVLGDGLGSEIHGWLEACAARATISNAGEFNGFLKPKDRLLKPELPFEGGAIHLPKDYRPKLDRAAIQRFTVETLVFER
jgi:L-Ala-D/L-Glu epimerase